MNPELRVTAITGGRNDPSARFRIEQMIAPLREERLDVIWKPAPVSSYAPATMIMRPAWFLATVVARIPSVIDSWRSSVTWLGREMVATVCTLEPFLKRPVVLDVDDAIWLPRGGHGIRRLVRHVDLVFAGNDFIADWFRAVGLPVEVVPTAVDVTRFRPSTPPVPGQKKEIVIGWTGTSSNHEALLDIAGALNTVMRARPQTRLLIVSDARPRLDELPSGRVDFVRWSPVNEVNTIQSMDVGLMPLGDTDWARGKCSYKMLLYMACGLPVVVSPVGMNANVLEMGSIGYGAVGAADWEDALIALVDSEEERLAMGQTAREVTTQYFSIEIVAELLAQGLRRAANA